MRSRSCAAWHVVFLTVAAMLGMRSRSEAQAVVDLPNVPDIVRIQFTGPKGTAVGYPPNARWPVQVIGYDKTGKPWDLTDLVHNPVGGARLDIRSLNQNVVAYAPRRQPGGQFVHEGLAVGTDSRLSNAVQPSGLEATYTCGDKILKAKQLVTVSLGAPAPVLTEFRVRADTFRVSDAVRDAPAGAGDKAAGGVEGGKGKGLKEWAKAHPKTAIGAGVATVGLVAIAVGGGGGGGGGNGENGGGNGGGSSGLYGTMTGTFQTDQFSSVGGTFTAVFSGNNVTVTWTGSYLGQSLGSGYATGTVNSGVLTVQDGSGMTWTGNVNSSGGSIQGSGTWNWPGSGWSGTWSGN